MDSAAAARDRISHLPDDLLHGILVRLRSTAAAARTSLVSRRWRHVWTQLPEIVFDNPNGPAADTVDAALTQIHAAATNNSAPPALSRLAITFPHLQFAPFRIAPWLAFASRHLAGELSIRLARVRPQLKDEDEVDLPLMEKARSIHISSGHILRLPPPSGSFAALKTVSIANARMDGRDMDYCFGSSRCPRLQELYLWLVELVAVSHVSIRSESLETLFYRAENTRRLEVVALAPKLRLLRAQGRSGRGSTAKRGSCRCAEAEPGNLAWPACKMRASKKRF
ncbi:hypothetical protein PR202_gb29742 [Eleusine coracana subsp. coracana]|uniref:F-box domain-containing protein n=1 Tax=Eleusine coracana subsp. coracana TaxID=191504 RepID=A0AAV5G062_ELECO|nr:hypothetical protein PR202_gb29742 [Eleusine coracana subsp. coracana]